MRRGKERMTLKSRVFPGAARSSVLDQGPTRRSRGFTLIELMLVVIIIGIIAAIAIPRIAGRTEKARLTAARADLSALSTALDSFELDTGRFPTTEEGLDALVRMPASLTPEDGWQGPYMRTREIPLDPWNREYHYKYPGEHGVDYDVYSSGPDGEEGTDDDVYSTRPRPEAQR
mgnify:CR=1 FL=1